MGVLARLGLTHRFKIEQCLRLHLEETRCFAKSWKSMCVKVASKCADAASMCVQKCKIAKSRVFGPDIGVESQKRVFKCSYGPNTGVESQKRVFKCVYGPDIGVDSQRQIFKRI